MPECCPDIVIHRLRNLFTLSFMNNFGRFCYFSGQPQTVLLFLAHFQALIVDNFDILALFQVLIAENFGILSTFSDVDCRLVLRGKIIKPAQDLNP